LSARLSPHGSKHSTYLKDKEAAINYFIIKKNILDWDRIPAICASIEEEKF